MVGGFIRIGEGARPDLAVPFDIDIAVGIGDSVCFCYEISARLQQGTICIGQAPCVNDHIS